MSSENEERIIREWAAGRKTAGWQCDKCGTIASSIPPLHRDVKWRCCGILRRLIVTPEEVKDDD